MRADRREPFAFSFAANRDDAGREIEVAVREADQLAHAQAGRVERFQNRAVANFRRLVALRRGEQFADLVGREKVRQLLRLPRIAERLGRIRFGPAFALAEAKEAADRRHPPRDRSLRVAGFVQRGEKATQLVDRDAAGAGVLPSSPARYSASAIRSSR